MSTPHADAQLAAVDDIDSSAAGAYDTPLGITNPPIDELLDRASSKYALVIYAAKRARQINDYYNQLGDGILEYVGPLVEPGLQEKPLSIALREIHEDLLEHTEGECRRGRRRAAERDTERKRIIVGVAGGIAAYKACTVVRQLTEAGHAVRVVPTESALRLRRRRHLRGAVRRTRHTGVLDDVHEVPHVRIGQEADLVVVAPATADLLARAVAGRADDLLTATLLTARCPVLFAPAMHTEMWFHPATVDNVATLRRRGAVVLEPASGPAHRRRQRRRPAARSRGDHHAGPAAAGPRRRAALRPGRRQGAGHRGRHPRTDRPGALHRQPQLGQAGLCDGPGGGPARRRRHADRGNTAGLVDPAGVEVVHIGSAVSCATRSPSTPRRARAGDGRRGGRLPARSTPASKIKKSSDPTPAPAIELTRTDDVLAGAVRAAPTVNCPICGRSSGSPPRPVTPTAMCCSTPAPNCAARLRPVGGQRGR